MRELLLRCSLPALVLFCGTLGMAQVYRVDTLARAPFAQYPVALAFVPGGDGSFFFTEKNSGRVRLFRGTLQPEPFVTVPVESEGEQGLLGIAVHPAYPDTPYVFLYYVRSPDRLGIIERYSDSAGIGIRPSQVLIVPRMDDATGNNGGSMAFGPDGCLYIGVGDHRTQRREVQDTSQRRRPWGKILRINPDGSIPPDNPSPSTSYWAWGLRNPQGLTFDDRTGALYCLDGGADGPNAVYRVRRGDNMGWPAVDRSAPPATTRPLFLFPEGRQPQLSGLALYRGNAFPRLRGSLVMAGNAQPSVWTGRLAQSGDSIVIERFFTYPSGFADLRIGPDGCIYLTNGPYLSSKILRISPIPPVFTSQPPPDAVQGVLYSYMPSCSGTPSDIALVEGPDGMTVESDTGRILWTPTNAQALWGKYTFVIRARNGAGTAHQIHSVNVINVNDPPTPFDLGMTAEANLYSFSGMDPEVTLRWQRSSDPDGDSLVYIVDVDTVTSFDSRDLRTSLVKEEDSLHVVLPRTTQHYFWRVRASDGRWLTTANPPYAALAIAFVPAPSLRPPPQGAAEPSLSQNYPNPFNPSTSIVYSVQRSGYVRLSVFNLLGQEVTRVFEGTQPVGTYEFSFNKLDLPSGIYFYRLQAPGIFETKKMVIAR